MVGVESSIWSDKRARWRKGDVEDDGFVNHPLSFWRLYLFYLAAFLVLLIFLARLFVLSVVNGERNRDLADNNRIKLVEFEPERGKIFDRRGTVLAQSQVQYILKKGDAGQEISAADAVKLEKEGKAGEYFDGVMGRVLREVRRRYSLRESAAHVLGYTSVVYEAEKKNDASISLTSALGRLGVEATYNAFLTGSVGKRLIEIDAEGRNVSVLGESAPTNGRNIHSTIDGDLQKVAFESLAKYAQKAGSKKGALVIQNPISGEVLALASAPSFDPENIARAAVDKNLPFFNRAVVGNYPPGSVFKIVTALAGLESGTISKNDEIEDVGQFEFGGEHFSNWLFNEYGRTDGLIKIERAIARSNDIFFFKLGQKMGLSPLRAMAIKLGYGQKTGIDLPEEAFGLVPDETWKKSAVGDIWYTGDTMHLAIGQGFMLTTPIQINAVTAFVASGKLTKPFLVSKIEGGVNSNEIKFEPKVTGENLVRGDNLELLRSGMKAACEVGGTGAPFFDAKYKVACKTGTAEELGGESHAWFTLYAPFDKPQIAMTVIVEHGGQGSAVAAPVAKEVMDWWMANRK